MYIAQFGPRDLVYDDSNGSNDIVSVMENNIEYLKFVRANFSAYLQVVLPEVVTTIVNFRFFFLSNQCQFKIAVDEYTNGTDDMSTDMFNPSKYINERETTYFNAVTNRIGRANFDYDQISHKVPQDRCFFRITSSQPDTRLLGILLRAV